MNTTSQTVAMASAASLLIFMTILLLLIFIFYVIPAVICYWKLFKKAGKGGWEAIVPFYNTIVMTEIAKKPMWMAGLAIVSELLASSLQRNYPTVGSLFSLVALVFGLIILVNFFKQYTISDGQAVLVVLLPIIAVFMLGKVEFKGAAAATPQVAAQPGVQQPQAYAAPQPAPSPAVAPQPVQPAPQLQPQPQDPAPQAPTDQQTPQQ